MRTDGHLNLATEAAENLCLLLENFVRKLAGLDPNSEQIFQHFKEAQTH